MSPIGDAFRTRLRKFPSLVNCCTIDWFTAWPKDALLTVADDASAEVDLEDEVRGGDPRDVRHLPGVGRRPLEATTPRSAAQLRDADLVPRAARRVPRLLDVKRGEVAKAKNRYDVGLQKLADTAESGRHDAGGAAGAAAELVGARKEADELMVQIEKDSKEAAEVTRGGRRARGGGGGGQGGRGAGDQGVGAGATRRGAARARRGGRRRCRRSSSTTSTRSSR